MFGHDDDNHNDHDNDENNKPADETPTDETPANDDNWQHPGPPPEDDDSKEDEKEDEKPDQKPADSPVPAFSLGQPDSSGPDNHQASSDNDLIDLKQEALGKLSPLVGHLNQSPDEKFRTLMMMIQASDDQSLVREAYQTALKIDDEKERAQALLDIVNEINYFTQHGKSE